MKRFVGILAFIAILFVQCSDDLDVTTSSPEEYSSEAADDGGNDNGGDSDLPDAGQITAGEWNDLDHWDFWNELMQKQEFSEYTDHWGYYPFERYSVLLTDENNKAVADATVKLKSKDGQVLWQTKTDNAGTAELWPSLFSEKSQGKTLTVEYQGKSWNINSVYPYGEGQITYTLPVEASTPKNLDILFIVDATGSMGDEIDYLKSEVASVLNEVTQTYANLSLRLGAVFYRDEGDAFVVRNFALSTNLNDIIDRIKEQEASGGGDYPEAVDLGLQKGIDQQVWSENAVARLAFIILDAPPHHVNKAIENMQQTSRMANQEGVKIIPVTASGTDLSTEMLMRFLAISTNGTYVFVTDDSGIGGDHLEPSVGNYEVEYLNDLLIRLIKKYSHVKSY